MFAVVVRSSLVRAVTGLCLSSALVACDVEADNTLTADLPTSDTVVRIALFGEGDKAPANSESMVVWAAWVIREDDGETIVLDMPGEGVATQMLTLKGEPMPAVDLDFGEPPAAALVEDSGGRFAEPMAVILDRSIDPSTLTRLGDLPGSATLGLSGYLGYVPVGSLSAGLRARGFGEGVTNHAIEGEEPIKLSFVPVATAAGQFEYVAGIADMIVR